MDAYSKDLLRGVGGADDGEKKAHRLESRTEEVDLSLGLSLGGRFGAEKRSGEGLAGSSSVALAPPAPVRTNSPQGSDFPLNGVVVEPSALLRATLQGSGFLRSAAEVQPSATLQGSIKEEPVEGILRSASSLPAGIEGGLRKRKPEDLKWLEAERRIKRMKFSKVSAGEPKMRQLDLKGTPSAEGRSLSSAIVPWSEGTNGVMAIASSSASAVIAAALGSGGEQQGASERPAAMVREMPLVWTSGLPNGMRTVGFLYEYSRVDEVRIMCACHGSFLTPAEFVEHAGGGQVANPLRSIIVRSPSWL